MATSNIKLVTNVNSGKLALNKTVEGDIRLFGTNKNEIYVAHTTEDEVYIFPQYVIDLPIDMAEVDQTLRCVIVVVQSASFKVEKNIEVSSGFIITCSATIGTGKFRQLYEMDDYTLADYDDMTLYDIDYVEE